MIAPARMADRVTAYLAERRRNGFGMSISGSQLAAFLDTQTVAGIPDRLRWRLHLSGRCLPKAVGR